MTKRFSPIAVVVFIFALVSLACGGSKAARNAVDLPASQQVGQAIDVPVIGEESSSAWQEFSSAEGNFSALFPVEPQEQVQLAPNAAVETEVHIFMADLGTAAYMIAYNELPAAVTPDLAGSEAVELSFDNLRESFLAGFDGTATYEQPITLEGYPGRQMDFTVSEDVLPGGGFGTVRVYAVADHLYQVAALGTAEALSNEDIDTFLSSFTLLEMPVIESEAAITTETEVATVSEPIEQVEPVEAIVEIESTQPEASSSVAEEEINIADASIETTETIEQPAEVASIEDYESVFPLPEVVEYFYSEDAPSHQTIFQTDLTLEEALVFYRDAFAAQGLTERTLLTNIVEDQVFSLVFDGSDNGIPLVIQAVNLGDNTSITLRYENF